ncbi:Zinc finger protein 497 [Chionoecetes opilio]|uniref:Zinc finger protein 497 n=1 Tax=Chionoecetes opilio TaxID=41210 RepID=A0A8J4Y4P6_CHIOP|nr:Zinc finger protein 497 [Chionoecetes opilio]
MRHLDYQFKSDSTKRQRKEDFHNKVDVWSQKLACSSQLVEPFECLEATLHRDLAAELGVAAGREVFLSLQQQGATRGVRVTETGPGHMVVAGPLAELLASRDVILDEIRQVRGLPKAAVSCATRDVGVMRSRKQLLGRAKARSGDKRRAVKGLSDRAAKKRCPDQSLKDVECGRKLRSKKGIVSEQNYEDSPEEDSHIVTERAAKKRCQSQDIDVECGRKLRSKKGIITKHSCPDSPEEDCHASVGVQGDQGEPGEDHTRVVSDQSPTEANRVENEVTSEVAILGLSQDCSISPVASPGTDGDEGMPMEGCVPIGAHKDSGGIEDMAKECVSVRTEQPVAMEEAVESVEEEAVFGGEETIATEELQDTQDPSEVKFKFSCNICSYKSMRENHFLKHMQLHDKVSPPSTPCLKHMQLHDKVSPPSTPCLKHMQLHDKVSPPSTPCLKHMQLHDKVGPASTPCLKHMQLHDKVSPASTPCLKHMQLHDKVSPPSTLCLKHMQLHDKVSPPSTPCLKHMQLHDKGLALYRCSECSFVSIRASHLRRHKMSHAAQVLPCHLCAYTCDDHKLLAKHVRVKHHTPKQPSPSEDLFECEECEYKTSWHYAFQRHRRTHASAKVVVMHSCPQCHYKTVRREHFLRHIKNVHQNYRPFLCDICGKAFKRQDALKQHHVSHYQSLTPGHSGPVGPYGFVCHICQKVCRSAAYLKEHMATHSEERSFLCEVCGASFKTRSVQRNHVQTIHRRPRAFTCTACDKKFNTKFALRRHMKQHDISINVMEELQDLDGNTRVRVNVVEGQLCTLPAGAPTLLPNSTPSLVHLPRRSRSPLASTGECSGQPPASAYQITINGQPAFLLPQLHAHQATLEAGQPCITKGGGAALVGGEVEAAVELTAAFGNTAPSAAVSVPVVPATVHILNQHSLCLHAGYVSPLAGGGAALVGGEVEAAVELTAAFGNTAPSAAVSVPVVPATVHILNQNTISTGSSDLILSSEHYDGGQGSSVVGGDTALLYQHRTW